MKHTIASLAKTVYFSRFLEKLNDEVFDKIISTDMDEVVGRFNNGEHSVLDEENVKLFIKTGKLTNDFIEILIAMKELLRLKDAFLKEVTRQKNNFGYEPYKVYAGDTSYGLVMKAIEKAKNVLNDRRFYQILRFYLRYETLIDQMIDRHSAINGQERNIEKRKKLDEILEKKDTEFGIVQVSDTEKGTSVFAGTRRDMELSDLLGAPFAADMYQASYDYGPHGDYTMPERIIHKSFHEPETAWHKSLIRLEKTHRKALLVPRITQQGFITDKTGSCILITNSELFKGGIVPSSVGWEPLTLEIRPIRLGQLKKENIFVGDEKLSPKQRLSVKTNLVLKGRK